ncbi:MAG: hypothetical protein ACR2PG_13690 [Hyphomicrobiaceae bacterium]
MTLLIRRVLGGTELYRAVNDFLLALAVFAAFSMVVAADRDIVNPAMMAVMNVFQTAGETFAPAVSSRPEPANFGLQDAAIGQTSLAEMRAEAALASVTAALLFSLMVTFNLAFIRHLRRIHAASRRATWKGS